MAICFPFIFSAFFRFPICLSIPPSLPYILLQSTILSNVISRLQFGFDFVLNQQRNALFQLALALSARIHQLQERTQQRRLANEQKREKEKTMYCSRIEGSKSRRIDSKIARPVSRTCKTRSLSKLPSKKSVSCKVKGFGTRRSSKRGFEFEFDEEFDEEFDGTFDGTFDGFGETESSLSGAEASSDWPISSSFPRFSSSFSLPRFSSSFSLSLSISTVSPFPSSSSSIPSKS